MIQKINFYTHIYKTYTVTQCILSRISSTKKKKIKHSFMSIGSVSYASVPICQN